MYCVLPPGQRKASPHAPPSQPRSHTASHSASALHASSASTIVSYQPYRRSEQCAACSRTYGRGGGGALGSGIVGGSGGDAGGAGGGRDGDGTGGDGGGGDGGGRKRGPQVRAVVAELADGEGGFGAAVVTLAVIGGVDVEIKVPTELRTYALHESTSGLPGNCTTSCVANPATAANLTQAWPQSGSTEACVRECWRRPLCPPRRRCGELASCACRKHA